MIFPAKNPCQERKMARRVCQESTALVIRTITDFEVFEDHFSLNRRGSNAGKFLVIDINRR